MCLGALCLLFFGSPLIRLITRQPVGPIRAELLSKIHSMVNLVFFSTLLFFGLSALDHFRLLPITWNPNGFLDFVESSMILTTICGMFPVMFDVISATIHDEATTRVHLRRLVTLAAMAILICLIFRAFVNFSAIIKAASGIAENVLVAVQDLTGGISRVVRWVIPGSRS